MWEVTTALWHPADLGRRQAIAFWASSNSVLPSTSLSLNPPLCILAAIDDLLCFCLLSSLRLRERLDCLDLL